MLLNVLLGSELKDDQPLVSVRAAVEVAPALFRRFRMIAAVKLHPDPWSAAPSQWVVGLLARGGSPGSPKGAGATHQVKDGKVLLGGGQDIDNFFPRPERLDPIDVYGDEDRICVLETEIDCESRLGRSRLITRNKTWERIFDHPFQHGDSHQPAGAIERGVTSLGPSVAFNYGKGRVDVGVLHFRIEIL